MIDENSLRKAVVPILFKNNGLRKIQIGSGFIIAAMGKSALLVTASHVLQDAIVRSQSKKTINLARLFGEEINSIDPTADIIIPFSDKTNFGTEGTVSMAFGYKDSDLAILKVEINENSGYLIDTQINILSKGPDLNDEVIAIGFFDVKDVTSEFIPPGMDFLFKYIGMSVVKGKRSRQIIGHVKEIYEGRNIYAKTPTFRTDIPFHSCMSGGVILKKYENEYVACGVISHDTCHEKEHKYGTGEYAISSILMPLIKARLMHDGKGIMYSYKNSEGEIVTKEKCNLLSFIRDGKIKDYSDNEYKYGSITS